MLFLGRGPRGENPSIPGNKFSLPRERKSLRSHLFLRRVNKSDTAVNAKRSQSAGPSPVLHALRAVLPHWESHSPLGQSWAGFGGGSSPAAARPWLCVTSVAVARLQPGCRRRGRGVNPVTADYPTKQQLQGVRGWGVGSRDGAFSWCACSSAPNVGLWGTVWGPQHGHSENRGWQPHLGHL